MRFDPSLRFCLGEEDGLITFALHPKDNQLITSSSRSFLLKRWVRSNHSISLSGPACASREGGFPNDDSEQIWHSTMTKLVLYLVLPTTLPGGPWGGSGSATAGTRDKPMAWVLGLSLMGFSFLFFALDVILQIQASPEHVQFC